jgi:hypothetical protein
MFRCAPTCGAADMVWDRLKSSGAILHLQVRSARGLEDGRISSLAEPRAAVASIGIGRYSRCCSRP